MTMSKKLIMKVFTPILTFLMALVLITTTLAWYTFILETEPVESSISITATMNEGGDGYDAIIDVIGDNYSSGRKVVYDSSLGEDIVTDIYYVDSLTPEVGYCGQTGLPEDTIYDVPYIIFVKATIEVPDKEKFGMIDMAYVNGASIYWEKDTTTSFTFDKTLKDRVSELAFLENETIEYYDENGEIVQDYDSASKLQIDLSPILDEEGKAISPNELSYNEWKVIMLEKEDLADGLYDFAASSIMVLDEEDEAANENTLVYYIGVKFHNGTSERFSFSDTLFTGCKFSLDLKFVSSSNNSYITLETNQNENSRKAPNVVNGNPDRVDKDKDWITRYTYYYDGTYGDYIRIYNALDETYINGFINFDKDTIGSSIIDGRDVEYYKVPETGNYVVTVTVYRSRYEILVTTDRAVDIFYEGDTNAWDKTKMIALTDQSQLSEAIANINKTYSNAVDGKYSSKQNSWYTSHLDGFNSSNYTIYRTSAPITSSSVFSFDLMSTNLDLYQNGTGERFMVSPGTYHIYAIVPKTVDYGKVTDSKNVTVVYAKISDVQEVVPDWYIKCQTNSFSANDNYKLTKMPGSIKLASTFVENKTFYSLNAVSLGNGNNTDLRYYYEKVDDNYVLTNDAAYDASKTYYTFTSVTNLTSRTFRNGTYYEALNENVTLTPYYTIVSHNTAIEGFEYYELIDGGKFEVENNRYYYNDASTNGKDFVKVDLAPGAIVQGSYFVKSYEINSDYVSSKTILDGSVYFTCKNGSIGYINLSQEPFNIANANNMISFGYESLDQKNITYLSNGKSECIFSKSKVEGRIDNKGVESNLAFMFLFYEEFDEDTNDASVHGIINVLGTM